MSDATVLKQDANRHVLGGVRSPDMADSLIAEIPALAEIACRAQELVRFWDEGPADLGEDGENAEQQAEYYESGLREAVQDFLLRAQYRVPAAGFREALAALEYVEENLEPDRVSWSLLKAIQLRFLNAPHVLVRDGVRRALSLIKREEMKEVQNPAREPSDERPFRGTLVPDICDAEDVAAALKIDVAAAEKIMRDLPHREVRESFGGEARMVCERHALMAWINHGKVFVSQRDWDANNGLAVAAIRFLKGEGSKQEMQMAFNRLLESVLADRAKDDNAADEVAALLEKGGVRDVFPENGKPEAPPERGGDAR